MAKTVKNYQLSNQTLEALEYLKLNLPNWTETEIVEAAIEAASRKLKTATNPNDE